MTIWCAVILVVGLIIAAAIVAVGMVFGGLCSTETAVQAFMTDEDWDKYQNRVSSIAKKYVSGMFGD